MLEEHPNLDTFEHAAGFWGRYTKTSLGNAVRLLRPLNFLGQGHKRTDPTRMEPSKDSALA